MSESATKPITKKEAARIEREEYTAKLLGWLPPGSTVYTILRHVSRSGMSRDIDLYCWIPADDGGEPVKMYLSGYAATILNERRTPEGAIKVGGCGMDMGFHLVSSLSWNLYPNGYGCIGEGKARSQRCPSNDHSNGDRDYTKNSKGRPHWHKSGDYALRQEWI